MIKILLPAHDTSHFHSTPISRVGHVAASSGKDCSVSVQDRSEAVTSTTSGCSTVELGLEPSHMNFLSAPLFRSQSKNLGLSNDLLSVFLI